MGSSAKLNKYLKDVKETPFAWGEHDCFTFTNNAFKEMHGEGWGDDLAGKYLGNLNMPYRRDKLRVIFGYRTFEDAVDDRLERLSSVPPRGSLVTTKHSQRWSIGVAMGISVGTSAAFLSKKGVMYLPIELIDKAWGLK